MDQRQARLQAQTEEAVRQRRLRLGGVPERSQELVVVQASEPGAGSAFVWLGWWPWRGFQGCAWAMVAVDVCESALLRASLHRDPLGCLLSWA